MQARVVPYLTVHDGSAALRFYADAFGAREIQRVAMENGRLGHAEFQINGATLTCPTSLPRWASPRHEPSAALQWRCI